MFEGKNPISIEERYYAQVDVKSFKPISNLKLWEGIYKLKLDCPGTRYYQQSQIFKISGAQDKYKLREINFKFTLKKSQAHYDYSLILFKITENWQEIQIGQHSIKTDQLLKGGKKFPKRIDKTAMLGQNVEICFVIYMEESRHDLQKFVRNQQMKLSLPSISKYGSQTKMTSSFQKKQPNRSEKQLSPQKKISEHEKKTSQTKKKQLFSQDDILNEESFEEKDKKTSKLDVENLIPRTTTRESIDILNCSGITQRMGEEPEEKPKKKVYYPKFTSKVKIKRTDSDIMNSMRIQSKKKETSVPPHKPHQKQDKNHMFLGPFIFVSLILLYLVMTPSRKF